ncbi:MAG: hypothetical protein M1348_02310 [Candidatus Parvarchaeota archaeon]|nr:hypothetical protein [Candidatus Parvarchaeota archaeon]
MHIDSQANGVSKDYETYAKKVEDFNSYLNSTISDIYKKLGVIAQSVNELDKGRKDRVDPAYVEKIGDKVDRLATNINDTIMSFNSAIDRLNQNYKDSFGRINKLNGDVDTISQNLGKLSTELTKTVNNFNSVSQKVGADSNMTTSAVTKMNEAINKFSGMTSANINELKTNDNELASKINKITEDLYSGLPNINRLADDVNELKRLHSNINARFESITNATNALTVESNGLNLKLETIGKEFQNVQQGIVDTQKHVMDFISIARAATSSVSTYNPETLNIAIRKTEDRTETLDKELTKVLENYNGLEKGIAALSGKVSDLSVVKNANKLFETVQTTAKTIEDEESRINAQMSRVEVMFNEMKSYMNKVIDINTKLNETANKIDGIQTELDKIKGKLPLFATKEDIMEMHNRLDRISKGV